MINSLKNTEWIDFKKGIVGSILSVMSLVAGCIWLEWYTGLSFALTFLIAGFVKIDIESTKWKYIINLIWGIIIAQVTFQTTFLMIESQYTIKITNYKIFLNIICLFAVCAIPFFVTTNWKKAIIITSTIMVMISSANGFIYQFRGKELVPMDLLSIKTAMNVMGQYSAQITPRMVQGWISWLTAVFIQYALPELPELPRKKTRINIILVEAILILFLYISTNEITVRTWTDEGTRINGYYLNFYLNFRDSFVDKPENYSPEKVEEYSKDYTPVDAMVQQRKPNIIVIMDESFVDFRVFNGELRTSEPIMPYFDSLSENVIKGYALSSVYGGNTANSEFEFLTGHSLAWLPDNAVVYQQYINNKRLYTLTWMLRNYGYKSFATHPYYETGWSRNRVYPHIGFEEFTFIDDYPQQKMMRKYVSDQEMFEYVMNKMWYKEPGQPLFLFGVSMQNHGGFDYEGENFVEDIELLDYSRKYPKAKQYMNVSNETDKALEYLLTSLANYPEETIVLFYGDHFPKVETKFYEELNGGEFDTLPEKMLQYKIPFMIWANFDIPDQTVECTSINYLSRYLMEAAGFELSPYHQYLKEAEEIIPAMNSQGYFSKEKNEFITYDEAEGIEKEWIEKHSILQYNNLFDRKNRNEIFFGQYIPKKHD